MISSFIPYFLKIIDILNPLAQSLTVNPFFFNLIANSQYIGVFNTNSIVLFLNNNINSPIPLLCFIAIFSLLSPSSQSPITDIFSSGDIILGILLFYFNTIKDESNLSKNLSNQSK